jgi:8-oxo-dGTP diphosphatase
VRQETGRHEGARSEPSPIHVVAGALFNERGEVLIAQRPAHKLYPGQWEFPGGKIEAGESARDALVRELREELGVEVQATRPLMRLRHRYPEFTVLLDLWQVQRFAGAPRSDEHPALAWVHPDRLYDYPMLAADAPLVTALRLPAHYVFTPGRADAGVLTTGLAALPEGALLRLRLPQADDHTYAAAAQTLASQCRAQGLQLILDRDPELVTRLGACGWHASAARLAGLARRPLAPEHWFIASCHTREELVQAQALGADAAVIGPVRTTASHPGRAPLTWVGFGALADAASLPVYAIGGLGPAELHAARDAGAQGVAGISAYWQR